VQSLPKHPQSSLRAAFSWRWRGMAEPRVSRCNRYQNKSTLRLSFMDFSNKTI
jgi:hypothetical protein